MDHLLNDAVKAIEISGIRRFFNLVQGKEDILSLTIGQPDFYTPEHVKKSAKHAIDMNHTTYTHNAGILPLREAISTFVHKKYQLSYRPEDEIIVTVGASQAIDITLRTILKKDDEVILPGPVYPGYEPLIKLAGAKPVFIDTRENGFKLTADLIKSHLSPKTKAILIPYPSNPTGVTLNEGELEEIATLIDQKEIFLIADEIYSELVYDQSHYSIGRFTSIRDQIIIINGLSKSHSMTGFRIGYILAPSWLAKHILKVHQYNVSCASSISQYAALEAIKNGAEDPEEMKKSYKMRRDYIIKRCKEMKLHTYVPDGGFYFFIDISHLQSSSFDIALDIVEKAKLALVPGSAFSQYGEGFLRLSYAYDLTTLQQGMDRLENYFKNILQ
ncbi:aminotransferase [Gracilibacillus ureilyticus]|uniref:Aminotransferase n=1 Tax=Gracilibacillus ureilyticus TaxID=531814 RepID=A0A1H9TM59_9BACI|nr:aminotransferase A [Gracilibacillus ureilyticus]SER98094.1 aminotransferase [Gracilibacillus ureilyticus]